MINEDGSYQLNFKVSGQPLALNKVLRMHYHSRNKYNKRWYDIIHYAVWRQLPPKPLDKATITIILHLPKRYDYDGGVGALKPLIDGLVHAKVIRNDSYVVTGPWYVTQELCKKGLQMVEISIVERFK